MSFLPNYSFNFVFVSKLRQKHVCQTNRSVCQAQTAPQRSPHASLPPDLTAMHWPCQRPCWIKRPPTDPFNLCVFVNNLCSRCIEPAAMFEGQLFYSTVKTTGFASHFDANWVQAPALLLFCFSCILKDVLSEFCGWVGLIRLLMELLFNSLELILNIKYKYVFLEKITRIRSLVQTQGD